MTSEQAKNLLSAVTACEHAQAMVCKALNEARLVATENDCALLEVVLGDVIEKSSTLHLYLNDLSRCCRVEAGT